MGFYLMGSFRKGKKAFAYINTAKPAEWNKIDCVARAKPFHFLRRGGKTETIWFNEWEHIDYDMRDLVDNPEVAELANDIWEVWCKKHKRKFEKLEWEKC